MEDWELYLVYNIDLELTKSTQDLFYCCRLYSCHFDTYLNSMCRSQIYPRARLEHHYKNPIKYHRFFVGKFFCQQIRDFAQLSFKNEKRVLHKKYRSLKQLIACLKQKTVFMYNTFLSHHWVLKQPMRVFRCLVVDKGNIPTWKFCGFTSTTYVLESALQFIYNYKDEFNPKKHDCYILDIILPMGTRFIPLSLSSIQEEHEILILSQGNLICRSSFSKTIKFWNRMDTLDDNMLPYTNVSCQFQPTQELPSLSSFRLSE
jgi:hypothetical protein